MTYQRETILIQDQQYQCQQTFISPEQLLSKLLLLRDDTNCQCNNQQEEQLSQQERNQINLSIKQHEENIANMDKEVMEVEHLLQVRQKLYVKLQALRQERENIQSQIVSDATYYSQCSQEIEINNGIKQMNERLRHRILQFKEFISKMQMENKKLQATLQIPINTNTEIYLDQKYYKEMGPIKAQLKHHQYQQEVRSRIQRKQDEAWKRLRQQQSRIAQRNRNTLNNINKMYKTFEGSSSFKYRTHYQ